MDQGFLRSTGTVHFDRSPGSSETLPMRNPTTGEPCAGEPHARFGGRGGQKPSLPLSWTQADVECTWMDGTSPSMTGKLIHLLCRVALSRSSQRNPGTGGFSPWLRCGV